MGIPWMAVAPRRRNAVAMSKLGELMFQQTYTLDPLLAQPFRPPSYGLKRPVRFVNQRATTAVGAAVLPAGQAEQNPGDDTFMAQRSNSSALQATPAPITAAETHTLLSPLEALPPELVDAVLAAIVRLNDLYALGCALPRLWPYVSRHVEEVYLTRKLGTWAMTPIAIVSLEWPSDPGPQDPERNYPAGLLTADDVAEISRGIGANEVKSWGRPPGVHKAVVPVRLYDLADARYYKPYPDHPFGYCAFPGLEAGLRRSHRLRDLLKEMDAAAAATTKGAAADGGGATRDGSLAAMRRLSFCDQLAVMLAHAERVDSTADFYPAERGPYILRNLTTKQLVRGEALARPSAATPFPKLKHPPSGPFLNGIKFGDVVAAHILWQEGVCAWPDGLKHVPDVESWAGHRFDITTLRRHQREEGRAGRLAEWSDISEKIGREMRSVWRALWGVYI